MHFLSLASIALAASGASAIVIPRSHVVHARDEKPATYYEGYLEPYDTYHTRYLAIDCESQHNTAFFKACCHPMLATETLAKNRAPECNPANHVSSSVSATHAASSAHATATQVLSTGGDDDEGCDDEDDEPTSTASSAAPTATDDGDEDCDDEDDEPSSSAAPSSTHHTSTQAPETTASPTHSTASSTHSETPASTTSSTPKPSSTHSATSTKTATPTKSTAAPAETSAASSDKGPFTGNATFYFQGGQAGACGAVNPDSAFIAAMQTKRYGDLGAKSALCGQKVKITNQKNGKTVTVTIADACPTCGTENDIDLSQGAFDQIATEEEGEVPISWVFL
ncbi:RlpA-like double-psi beta-barrel-protein domain-containing protein-containing protein [Trametes meyenii]|nr:RlpA-like double-psi beta-barrel-protein domain-containing protein-containing protein [Trametes meyenii]